MCSSLVTKNDILRINLNNVINNFTKNQNIYYYNLTKIFYMQMNYLENDDFVLSEVIPTIRKTITEYLENERYYEWFENSDDVEEFAYSDIDYDLEMEIKTRIYEVIKECESDYDFSNVTTKILDENIFENILNEAWIELRDEHTDMIRDEFDKHSYDEEYYDIDY